MKTNLFGTVLRGRNTVLATLAMSAMVTFAHADLITNGDFSAATGNTTITGCPSHCTTTTFSNQLSNGSYSGATATGWTSANNSYNMLYVPGDSSADSTSGHNNVTLYGPPTSSGNFVALDADYGTGKISQSIATVAGEKIAVTFTYAVAQQTGYTGYSTDYLAVSLGGQTLDSNNVYDASQSLSGWYTQTLDFTATTTGTETLSFLAQIYSSQYPGNLPSFVLVDSVSANEVPPTVPEPGSLALLSTGLIGLGGLVRSRFKK